ncbi:hypothetical protein AGMMS49957_01860 [Synergistales bacterium]|nr:hypothetical protein AGMMS49957_01860 [Synergistales bacterium]
MIDIIKRTVEQIVEKILNQAMDFLIPCFIILSVLVYLPEFREVMGMQSFYMEYRPWINFLWLYVSASIIWKTWENWRAARYQARKKLIKIREINGLPEEERAIIGQLLQPGMDRIWLSIDNPAAANLRLRKILVRIAFDLSRERQGLYQVDIPGYWYCLNSEVKQMLGQIQEVIDNQLDS